MSRTPETLRIGVAQTQSGLEQKRNAEILAEQLNRLADQGATLLFTPETAGFGERNREHMLVNAHSEADEPMLKALCDLARDRQVSISLGSLAIRTDDNKLANRSFLISRQGEIIARYDKIHMFDVSLPGGESYRESHTFAAGDKTVVADVEGVRIGFTVCYDLRFPALHNLLAKAGAQIIIQPSAFTAPTGEAHWHALLRARAIETGSFVVAAAQTGKHENGRVTFGHSLVVDPWGKVLLDMETEVGEAIVDLNIAMVDEARSRIPNLQHGRPLPEPVIQT